MAKVEAAAMAAAAELGKEVAGMVREVEGLVVEAAMGLARAGARVVEVMVEAVKVVEARAEAEEATTAGVGAAEVEAEGEEAEGWATVAGVALH